MVDNNPEASIPVVGIGASAGGLEALEAFVSRISPNSGACYVIVQHLAPNQPSIMDQLLQAKTSISVSQIEDGEPVIPNHIFIVPPGRVLRLEDDHFQLQGRPDKEKLHRPVDTFFSSLADIKGRDAYCVILSGTGSDGAEGLKAVKAGGGFAFVQESANARFPGMPDSAVATGLVDLILPAEEIPGRLEDILYHRRQLRDDQFHSSLREQIEAKLPAIAERLAEISGNDFSSYKPGTLIRRIERRMTLLRLQSVDRFVEILHEDTTQAELLAQEFLVGVTQFFRDAEAFEALRHHVVVPTVQTDQHNIRVWVPGCSTGEEAYSIAILFLEEIERTGRRHVLQVFGTDIDLPGLVNARYGLFSASAIESLSPERREKYFVIEGGQFRAIPSLREACVFAPHNLVQDPPFSRLDLISCRNLLIYLSNDLQKQVIPRFHFSLRPTGHLFLGPSEGVAGEETLFNTIDKAHKIFQKNPDAETRYSALKDPVPRPRASMPGILTDQTSFPPPQMDLSRETVAEREFLRQHAAPFALLNSSGEILFISPRMADFVRPSAGAPSNMIDAYLMRELRVPVRSALTQAAQDETTAMIEDILVEDEKFVRFFDIKVSPTTRNQDHFLLTLNEVRSVEAGSLRSAMDRRADADRDMLEVENFNLRRQLTAVLQEHETSGQELKSTNEELLSMNEELQSSNEELETSREELQSINEELETVNAELQENNRQLLRANSDLKNLFESTDLAVLFLDRNFCVRNFTPSTSAIFGVRHRDIGRPISDLSSRVDYPGLRVDADQVDKTLQPVEREVTIPGTEETFILRMRPYRTTENVIDGYVLSFIDISRRKQHEQALKRNEEQLARQYAELENLYDTTPVGLCLVDREFRWIRINESLAEMNGFPAKDHLNKRFDELVPDIADELKIPFRQVFDTGEPQTGLEISGTTSASPGEERHWILDLYPVRSNDEIFAVGACVREVTEQTRMLSEIREHNERQRLLLAELQHRVKNTLATIGAIARLLLRGSDSPREYQSRLLNRLNALARTHDLLTEVDWREIRFSQLIENELEPYLRENASVYTLKGPELLLDSKEAISLGMAIHELTTNSAKYGALSVDQGHIVIKTTEDGNDPIVRKIEWSEKEGPEIESPPEHRGFGSVIIEQVLARDLDAETEIRFAREGLYFSVTYRKETSE